jgi:spermidine/putrescine transport system ATP-binding protein
VTAAIRPEDIVVGPAPGEGEGSARLTGTVFHGRLLRLHLALDDGTELLVDTARKGVALDLAPGTRLAVTVRPGAARIPR